MQLEYDSIRIHCIATITLHNQRRICGRDLFLVQSQKGKLKLGKNLLRSSSGWTCKFGNIDWPANGFGGGRRCACDDCSCCHGTSLGCGKSNGLSGKCCRHRTKRGGSCRGGSRGCGGDCYSDGRRCNSCCHSRSSRCDASFLSSHCAPMMMLYAHNRSRTASGTKSQVESLAFWTRNSRCRDG